MKHRFFRDTEPPQTQLKSRPFHLEFCPDGYKKNSQTFLKLFVPSRPELPINHPQPKSVTKIKPKVGSHDRKLSHCQLTMTAKICLFRLPVLPHATSLTIIKIPFLCLISLPRRDKIPIYHNRKGKPIWWIMIKLDANPEFPTQRKNTYQTNKYGRR